MTEFFGPMTDALQFLGLWIVCGAIVFMLLLRPLFIVGEVWRDENGRDDER